MKIGVQEWHRADQSAWLPSEIELQNLKSILRDQFSEPIQRHWIGDKRKVLQLGLDCKLVIRRWSEPPLEKLFGIVGQTSH